MSVHLDNLITIDYETIAQGFVLPYASLSGVTVIYNDIELTKDTDWFFDNNIIVLQTSSVAKVDTQPNVYIGIKFDFEIEPTNITELGEPGVIKRPEKIALYLENSGECAVSINGRSNKFGTTLTNNERIDGEKLISTKGGYNTELIVNLSGDGHKPFNLQGLGIDATIRQ